MITVTVTEEYHFSPQKVWDKLTDHASYKTYAPLKDSLLMKEGVNEKNGLGAMRKIVQSDSLYFLEEITVFDKYLRFDYLIRETSSSLKHFGGVITLEKTEYGTKVQWTSDFELPDASPGIQRATKSGSSKMFKEILIGAKKVLESENGK